mgnify:CR=1 FL=1
MPSDLDILNQKLEIFGLDDSTLLSISKISRLNVGEVYEKLRGKNSSKLGSGYLTYRGSMEEDLITILTVNLREDSFGHIELVNCFKPEHSLSIDEIMKNIDKLRNHLNSYKESHDKLGKTIGTAVNHYNNSSREFNKIDKDITKISGENASIHLENNTLERPITDE